MYEAPRCGLLPVYNASSGFRQYFSAIKMGKKPSKLKPEVIQELVNKTYCEYNYTACM